MTVDTSCRRRFLLQDYGRRLGMFGWSTSRLDIDAATGHRSRNRSTICSRYLRAESLMMADSYRLHLSRGIRRIQPAMANRRLARMRCSAISLSYLSPCRDRAEALLYPGSTCSTWYSRPRARDWSYDCSDLYPGMGILYRCDPILWLISFRVCLVARGLPRSQ